MSEAAAPRQAAATGPALGRRIRVDVADRGYDILVDSGSLARPETYASLPAGEVAVVVSNATVAPLLADRLLACLRQRFRAVSLVVLDDGEQFKTWDSVERIVDALLAAGGDRRSTLFALGGGVVGDLTGFAAACFMRGIAYVQVPTTLLAQVDSSVGGKTAVNHPLGKNLIGAFHQPRLVVADLETLATLPQRELIAGLAEVIKYGAVADLAFFDWIEARLDDLLRRDGEALAGAVSRSCDLKAAIVASDEKESGLRAILNFGHTFGHAIEAATGYGSWLHGEAVGCGMVLAADLSRRLGGIDEVGARRVAMLVERAGLPVRLPPLPAAELLALMGHDKKAEGGAPRFVLLDTLGRARVAPVEEGLVRDVLLDHGALR
ncbi:MAG: 3-dehydroquinate synthase [Burkholderiales bacterium]|nr:3-dehydroquinate synthase [Burkholderiales bacterium]